MKEEVEPKQIKNLKGVLCQDIWGKFFIRSQEPDGSEREYRIDHCDLSIKIVDDDVYAYLKDGEWALDYSPKTLGTPGSGKKGTDIEDAEPSTP